jgi:ankyrin repeat protein
VKDRDGNTPLIEALSHGSTDCAMVLLELDDVGDIVGKDGWAAAHYAAKIGDTEVLEAVLKHPSFEKDMKTLDGKTVDTVAMEAGTWCGRVKDLVRKYNSLD